MRIYNLTDNDDAAIVAQQGIFQVMEWKRDFSVTYGSAMDAYYASEMNVRRRQLVCNLNGKTGAVVQAGAMQWTVGSVHANTGVKSAGDFMGKMFRGAVSQDSVIKPEYSGTGKLVCEPRGAISCWSTYPSGAAPWCSTTGFSSRATAPSSTPCSAAQTFLARWRATRACST